MVFVFCARYCGYLRTVLSLEQGLTMLSLLFLIPLVVKISGGGLEAEVKNKVWTDLRSGAVSQSTNVSLIGMELLL